MMFVFVLILNTDIEKVGLYQPPTVTIIHQSSENNNKKYITSLLPGLKQLNIKNSSAITTTPRAHVTTGNHSIKIINSNYNF